MTSHCWGDRFHRINPGKLLNYEEGKTETAPTFRGKKSQSRIATLYPSLIPFLKVGYAQKEESMTHTQKKSPQ